MLTGKLPFESKDSLELIHCHLAKQPLSVNSHQSLVISEEIPQVVSDIVMKLMAKTSEERYQSAWGIKADLEECVRQLESKGVIERFPLATQDITNRFQIPQKLYGRDREIETLLASFIRISDPTSPSPSTPLSLDEKISRTELFLVSGYSGIGKSALVKEIYKPITQKQGYFISGKFDQY